ncbi:hypothetical protein K3495_g2616 [Podosphaera aphanis]|nr:hypothetical protein K3495_g2616 [Podosphaera aphanis]
MISSETGSEKKTSQTSSNPCEADQDKEATPERKSPSEQDDVSSEEGEVEENDDPLNGDEFHSTKSTSRESLTAPLPSEPPPPIQVDDGWAPVWEEATQGFFFYNRFTGASQWTNPRVPEASPPITNVGPPGVSSPSPAVTLEPPPPATSSGYNPAIHGDYDSNAWYAQPSQADNALVPTSQSITDPAAQYTATAAFNRFTGRFQNSEITPENFNDENKSKRQMNAYFDVDAAANSHDGRSLKAERSGKKLSKIELKQFKEKRKMKKEEKRRAWLRD